MKNQTIYVAEFYPHYMGELEATFTITFEELDSLIKFGLTATDEQQDALQDCIEARAGNSVYFVSDLLYTPDQMTQARKRLKKGKKAHLLCEEGVIGFSLVSAADAMRKAKLEEVKASC